MNNFFSRLLNLIIIIGAILGYNIMLENKHKSDEIEKLTAMIEANGITENSKDSKVTYKDGSYQGIGEGFGGTIEVVVNVDNGKITNIEIVSAANEDSAYLNMASEIVSTIIDNQSDEVDTISGATFSSNGIKDAVKQALEKAGT